MQSELLLSRSAKNLCAFTGAQKNVEVNAKVPQHCYHILAEIACEVAPLHIFLSILSWNPPEQQHAA
jgi:hypothetical protein